MKILALRFKNINSFRGAHEVDFTQKPLNNAGLFAITGPTGSGKTTLLDVIALALYNRVPRIDERISKNFIARSGSVLTRNTSSAYAEVEFQAHEGRFLSRWWIETARTGNLKDYEMEVHDMHSGQVLDVKKSEVPAKNEALIGLSYDQFMRSMLLAQGEFARFLKASKDERGKLLEKITGSWIYREIGRRVFETQNEYRKKIEKFTNQKEHLQQQLETAESYTDLIKQRNDTQQRVEKLEQEVNKLKEQVSKKENREQLIHQRQEWQKQLTDLRAEIELFEREKGRALDHHEALLPWQADLSDWQLTQKQLRDLAEKRKVWEKQMAEARESYKQARKAVDQFLNQGKAWGDDEAEWLIEQKQTAVEALLAKLDATLHRYSELSALAKEKLKPTGVVFEPAQPAKTKANLSEKEQTLKDEQAHYKQVLSDTEYNQPAEALGIIEETQTKMQQVALIAHDAARVAKQLNAQKNQLDELKENIEKVANELSIAERELLLAQKERENCELLIQQQQLRASLEEHRQQLKEGEPCPLCGSVHHPWTGDKPSVDSDLDKRLQGAKTEEQEVQKLVQQKRADWESFKKMQQHAENEKQRLQTDLETNGKKEQELKENLPEAYRNASAEDLTEKRKQLQRLQELNLLLEHCHDTLPLLQEMEQLKSEGKAIREELEIAYPPAKEQPKQVKDLFQKHLRSVSKEWQEALYQLKTLAERDKEWQNEHQTAMEKEEKLSNTLKTPLAELGYSSLDEALKMLLTGDKYQQLQRERSDLQQQRVELNSNMKHVEQRLDELQEAKEWPAVEELKTMLTAQQNTLQQQRKEVELLAAKCYEIEGWQKQLEKLDAEIAAENEQSAVWRLLNEYIGDAQGKKFSTFAQQLTMKQLIALANNRLKSLSERYRLDMPDMDTEDDSIVVLDYDMGGMRRSVKTLSGGESFLVSLSLALGLSDLASRDIRINSLFIDEGFGTLDPQTLDQTLDTLEKLQAESNKTIGIISHVEALKERIATQIVMQRNGQGFSKLQVVSG